MSKLASKWQSLNAQYHLKGANMNDASSSEEHIPLHIQLLNEMQIKVSIVDKTGHDKSRVKN
jgi:hypothetical protein